VSVNFSPAIVRRGLFHSFRFEIACILAIGVALPLMLLALIEGGVSSDPAGALEWATQPVVVNSVLGVTICACVSLAILRRLRFFPGVAVAKSILPVLAIVFGVFMAVIAVFRLEYSNKVILTCFLAVLVVRFAIAAVRTKAKGLLYYLVPGGRVHLVGELRSAPILLLQRPSLDSLPDCVIVADLYADLDPVEHLSENGFGALVPSFAYQKMKRAIDLGFSILAMPFILPVVAACALAIKLDSDGPVFFRQRRMGFRGREFFVLKLRTMTEGHAGEDRNLSITQHGDKRITRVGGFLRRTRLDELPQIFNILRGEMSWIGPRPEAVSLSAWYEAEIPFYRYRHIVRPGISGWAQVNQGHVAAVEDVNEKLQYDFYYIKHLSYWIDIIIVLRTVKVVLSGFGSK